MNETKNSFTKKFRHTLYILVGAIMIFSFCMGFLWLSSRGYFADPGKPMSKEDINYLCNRLEIKREPICISTEKVYPPDFSDLIEGKFEADLTSYEDVQSIFSQFQIKLDDDGESPVIFLSYYDINRDGVSDLVFYFNGTTDDSSLRFIVFKEDLEY